MFNNILFYLVIGLSASTMGFGYLSYSLSNDKAVAVEALKEAKEAVADYQKALNLKYLSCRIDDASTVQVEAEKKAIQTKTDEVSDKIEKLRKPVAVKQEIIKNESLKETNVLPDDGLLSPNLVRLLRENYCSVEPTDNLCRTP